MSQVNFFMTVDDEEGFLEFLFSRQDTHILGGRFFDSSNPKPLLSKEEILASELTLVNKTLSPEISATVSGGGDFSGKYLFDMFSDPIIEFSRSQMWNERLLDGRIFAKIGWLKMKEANGIYKSWYGSIERWLKARCRRVNKTWWFGRGAWEWSMAGGICCFGGTLSLSASLVNVDRS